ncbi:MAG: DUF4230 domain-containing protein [Clostridiales bacterium]|nr:DUF4230 domain-containing protein [Clostridiales bacterium]
MKKVKVFFNVLFDILLCTILVIVGIRFGPNLYYRLFGSGNTLWISERFSEELMEKNELVVFETTLSGRETTSQSAWLLGKVQEVVIPYSYTISFTVDLSKSRVTVEGNTIMVRLPPPRASFSKLTVDESNMKKRDWLYPLTPERYASIKTEIEQKLFHETSEKTEYLDAAWATAVKNMESLFKSVAEESEQGVTCDIQVLMEQPSPIPSDAETTSSTGLESPAPSFVPNTL